MPLAQSFISHGAISLSDWSNHFSKNIPDVEHRILNIIRDLSFQYILQFPSLIDDIVQVEGSMPSDYCPGRMNN